jgi:hypothetical protein
MQKDGFCGAAPLRAPFRIRHSAFGIRLSPAGIELAFKV